MLPAGLAARFDLGSWAVPSLFSLIQRTGGVSDDDMYHTFNMGLGIVLAVAADDAESIAAELPDAMRVGAVVRQTDERRVIIE